MHAGKLVFAQVMEFAPWHTFRRLVAKYGGDFNVRRFSCLDQFLCLAFAQLTYRESLRDIEACLRAQPAKLYHLGLRGNVNRSALADANEERKVAFGFLAAFAADFALRLAMVTVSTSFAFALTRRRHAWGSSLAFTPSSTTVVPIIASLMKSAAQLSCA